MSAVKKKYLGTLLILVVAGFSFYAPDSAAQTSSVSGDAAQRGQWMANMGEAGLRRAYSTGADLGELVNRSVSYQVNNRVYEQRQAQNPELRRSEIKSRVNSQVTQSDSLIPLQTTLQRPLFFRALGRIAWRDEANRLNSRNDRLDLGLLLALSPYSYIGVGIAGENTRSDLEFVNGNTHSSAYGPRVDAGIVLNSTWAVAARYDRFSLSGDNKVSVATGGGPLLIRRELDSTREYLSVETIGRYTRRQLDWLPEGVQMRWATGFQYLVNEHSRQFNSLGQEVREPFGHTQRLGIARSGVLVSSSFGARNNWSMAGELLLDYEVVTNQNFPINDRMTASGSVALARMLAPGQRVSLDYQRYQNRQGSRARNNFSLIAVLDF